MEMKLVKLVKALKWRIKNQKEVCVFHQAKFQKNEKNFQKIFRIKGSPVRLRPHLRELRHKALDRPSVFHGFRNRRSLETSGGLELCHTQPRNKIEKKIEYQKFQDFTKELKVQYLRSRIISFQKYIFF